MTPPVVSRRPIVKLTLTCIMVCLLSGSESFCPNSRTHCGPSCRDEVSGQEIGTYRELCRCDARCSLYNDCCVDYQENCANQSDPSPPFQSELSAYFGCVSPIQADSFRNNFVVVSWCPPDWPDDGVRINCEDAAVSSDDKFMTVLVNGPDDVVFKNIYCSICHGIRRDRIQPWSIQLWDCEAAEGETFPVTRGGKPNFGTCSEVDMIPPVSMTNDPHRCYQNYIDSCPDTAVDIVADHQTSVFCTNHTSIVFNTVTETAYKNIYCMFCNMPSVGQPECSAGTSRHVRPDYSVTLLFDFDGSAVFGVETIFGGRSTGSLDFLGNCSETQMFDPFSGVCRELRCPDGTRLRGETCIESMLPNTTTVDTGLSEPKASVGNSSTSANVENCMKGLLSTLDTSNVKQPIDYERFLDFKLTPEEKESVPKQDSVLAIYTDFASASTLANSLDRIHSNITSLNIFEAFSCNATLVKLVALSKVRLPDRQQCEGYVVNKIQLEEVFLSTGAFHVNISGYVYKEPEFIHETRYAFDLKTNRTAVQSSVTLCSPFGDEACPQRTEVFSRDDFHISESNSSVLVHTKSGNSFPIEDVWLLPDNTLRLCSLALPSKDTVLSKLLIALRGVSFAGGVCSVVALLSSLALFVILPGWRSQAGKVVIYLLVSLMLIQVALLAGNLVSLRGWLCAVKGAFLHLSWLAAFSWLTVLTCMLNLGPTCLHNRSPQQSHGYNLVLISLLTWGCPAVVIVLCFLMNVDEWSLHSSGDGSIECRIGGPWHTPVVLGIPGGVLLCIDSAVLGVRSCATVGKSQRLPVALRLTEDSRNDMWLCLKFLLVFGVNGIVFVVAEAVDIAIVSHLSSAINSLQGALVFLALFSDAGLRKRWRGEIRSARRCRCCGRGTRAEAYAEDDGVSAISNVAVTTVESAKSQSSELD